MELSKINKLLHKLPLILLCTIRRDEVLFDCRVLPQQGCKGEAGLGTLGTGWSQRDPTLWYQCETTGVLLKIQEQTNYVALDMWT